MPAQLQPRQLRYCFSHGLGLGSLQSKFFDRFPPSWEGKDGSLLSCIFQLRRNEMGKRRL